jgi:hypothetical protein
MQKRIPQPDDVKLSPSVPRSTWERLKSLALQQNRSLNDLLNEWIEEKLAADQPEEGKKGGVVYALGGLPAGMLADRKG